MAYKEVVANSALEAIKISDKWRELPAKGNELMYLKYMRNYIDHVIKEAEYAEEGLHHLKKYGY